MDAIKYQINRLDKVQILRRQSTRVSCGSVHAHCYNLHIVVRIFR